MFLMASTRCGISAKQMERELGVTYKQAHKMMKRIRTLMGDDGEPLSGDVEIDETSWGGKPRRPQGHHAYLSTAPDRRPEAAQAREAKATVLGMVERGGHIRFRVIIPFRHGVLLMRGVYKKVSPLFTVLFGRVRLRHNAKREGGALFTQLLRRAASGTRSATSV
jgi:hypothetical protein